MNRWMQAAVCAVAAGVLGGCVRPDPQFRVDALTQLPGIEGSWVQDVAPGADPASGTSLMITASDQPIADGRVRPRAVDADQLKGQLGAGRTRVYRVVVPITLDSGGTAELVLRGYVLRGDPAFLCLQSDTEIKDNAAIVAGIFSMPATLFFAVSLEDDRLELREVEPPVRLLTSARLLDDPSPDAGAPAATIDALLAGSKDDRALVTADPDRAAGVLARYAHSPGFLSAKPVVYHRAG